MEVLQLILSICGAVSVIGGAVAMIWKVFRPLVGFKKRIELIETEANEMQILIGQLMETNKVQNKALLAIINHMIDGNSVERLKETRDHMQSEMIET